MYVCACVCVSVCVFVTCHMTPDDYLINGARKSVVTSQSHSSSRTIIALSWTTHLVLYTHVTCAYEEHGSDS